MSTEKQNTMPEAVELREQNSEQDSPRQRLSEQAMEQGAVDSRDRVGRVADPQDRASFRAQCSEELSSIRDDLKQASKDMAAVNKAVESGAKPGSPEYEQLMSKAVGGYQTAIEHARSDMYEVNRDGSVQIDPSTGRPKTSDLSNRIKDEQRLLGDEMTFLAQVKQEGRQLTPDEMKKLSLDSGDVDEALRSRQQESLSLSDLQRSVGFSQANFGLALIRSSANSADRFGQLAEGQQMLKQAAVEDPEMMGPPPDPNFMKHFQEDMAVASQSGPADGASAAESSEKMSGNGFSIVPDNAAGAGSRTSQDAAAGMEQLPGGQSQSLSGNGFRIVADDSAGPTGQSDQSVAAAPTGRRGAEPGSQYPADAMGGANNPNIAQDMTQGSMPETGVGNPYAGLRPGHGDIIDYSQAGPGSMPDAGSGNPYAVPGVGMGSGSGAEFGAGSGAGSIPETGVGNPYAGQRPGHGDIVEYPQAGPGSMTDAGSGNPYAGMAPGSSMSEGTGRAGDPSMGVAPGGRAADQGLGTGFGVGEQNSGLGVVTENGQSFLTDGQSKMPTGDMSAASPNFVDPMELLTRADQQQQIPLSVQDKQNYAQAIKAADSLDRVGMMQQMQTAQAYMDNAIADPEKGPSIRQTLAAVQELDGVGAKQQAQLAQAVPILSQQGPAAQQMLQKLSTLQTVNDYMAFKNEPVNQAAMQQFSSLPHGAEFLSTLGGYLNNSAQKDQLDKQLAGLDPNFAAAQAALSEQQKLYHASEDTRAHYLRSLVSAPQNQSPENIQTAQQLVSELTTINPGLTQDRDFANIAQGLTQLGSGDAKLGKPGDQPLAPGAGASVAGGAAGGADVSGQAMASLQNALNQAVQLQPGQPLSPQADKLFNDTIALNKQMDPKQFEAMKQSLHQELYSPTSMTTPDGQTISMPAWTDEKEKQYVGLQKSMADAQAKVSPQAQQALQQASSPEELQAKLQQLQASDPTVKAMVDAQQQASSFVQANPDVNKRDLYEQQMMQINQLQHGPAIAESIYAAALAGTGNEKDGQKARELMQSAMKDPELGNAFPEAAQIAGQLGLSGDTLQATRTADSGVSALDPKTPGLSDFQNAMQIMSAEGSGAAVDRLGKAEPLFQKAIAATDGINLGDLDKKLNGISTQLADLQGQYNTESKLNENPQKVAQLQSQGVALQQEQAALAQLRALPATTRQQYAVALNHTAAELYGQGEKDDAKKSDLTKQGDDLNAKAETALRDILKRDPSRSQDPALAGAIQQVHEHKKIDDSSAVIGLVNSGNQQFSAMQKASFAPAATPIAATGNVIGDVAQLAKPVPGVGNLVAGLGSMASLTSGTGADQMAAQNVAQARSIDPNKANALVDDHRKAALSSGLHTANDIVSGTAGVVAADVAKQSTAKVATKILGESAMKAPNPLVKAAGFAAYGLAGLGTTGGLNKGLDEAEHLTLGTERLSTSEWLSHSAASFAAGAAVKGLSGAKGKIMEGAPLARPNASAEANIAGGTNIAAGTPKSSLLGDPVAPAKAPEAAAAPSTAAKTAEPAATAPNNFERAKPDAFMREAYSTLTPEGQAAVNSKFGNALSGRTELPTKEQMNAFGGGLKDAKNDLAPSKFSPRRLFSESKDEFNRAGYSDHLGMDVGNRASAYLNPKNLFNNIKEGTQGRYFNLNSEGQLAMNGDRLGTTLADYNARRFLGKTAWNMGEGAVGMGIYSGATTNPFLTNPETGENYGLGDTFKAAGEQAAWGGGASALAAPIVPKVFKYAAAPVTKPVGWLFNKDAAAVAGKELQGLNWGDKGVLLGTGTKNTIYRGAIGTTGGAAFGAGTHNPLVDEKYSWGDAATYGAKYGAIGGVGSALSPRVLELGSRPLATTYNHTVLPVGDAVGTVINRGRANLGQGVENSWNALAKNEGAPLSGMVDAGAAAGNHVRNFARPWAATAAVPFALAEGQSAADLDSWYKWGKISDTADEMLAEQQKLEASQSQSGAGEAVGAESAPAVPQQPQEQAAPASQESESGPVPNPYLNGG